MEERIIVPKLAPYTLVFNSIIRDDRLPLQVRAVYVLMLSTPPDWDFSVKGMATIAGVSRRTMSRFIDQLEEAGYVERRAQPREDGKFSSGTIVLRLDTVHKKHARSEGDEVPIPLEDEDTVRKNYARCEDTATVATSVPRQASPWDKSSQRQNVPQQNKDNINNILPPIAPQGGQRAKTVPTWMPERFEALWKYYPRNENRKAAVRAWDKLRPSSDLVDTMARSLKAQKKAWELPGAPTPPHLSTWLNGERWAETVYVRQEADEPAGPWLNREVI